MFINGVPVVPPACPAEHCGNVPDLSALPVNMYTSYMVDYAHGERTVMGCEVFITFGEPGEDALFLSSVSTESLEAPVDSPSFQEIHQVVEDQPGGYGVIRRAAPRDYSSPVGKVGRMLCQRVAECHGVINGACWALGASALREAIKEVAAESV